MKWAAGRFATGGIVKGGAALRDGEVRAILSARREWVKFPDGRIVEIHGDIFDPRYYTKPDETVCE